MSKSTYDQNKQGQKPLDKNRQGGGQGGDQGGKGGGQGTGGKSF